LCPSQDITKFKDGGVKKKILRSGKCDLWGCA
jgi:hypothetical protein